MDTYYRRSFVSVCSVKLWHFFPQSGIFGVCRVASRMSEGSDKDKGNAAFRSGHYVAALKHYDEAIHNAGIGACAALFSNKAAALHKLERYDDCIEQCKKALVAPGLTPELISKIYFEIVLAYEAQEKFEEALETIKNCVCSPTILEKCSTLSAKLSISNPEATRIWNDEVVQSASSLGIDVDLLKCVLDNDQKRRTQRCHSPQSTVVSELIADHNRSLSMFKALNLGQCCSLPVRFDTLDSGDAASFFSTALLFSLKPITIRQLPLEEVNVGKVLICRTIVDPLVMHALLTVVEDRTGDAVRVAIYNLRSPSKDTNSLLPLGTCLAIKEPWYKSDEFDGIVSLRVDNPANLVYLDKTHSLLKGVNWPTQGPQTWQFLEKRANKLFLAGSYEIAVVAYTDAIEIKRKFAPKEVADLLANRAAAYLADEKPTDAYWDCQSALFVQPDHLKATLRLAKAHANLGQYEEARAVLVKSPHTAERPFKTELSRMDRLIGEQKSGEYDLKSLLKEAAASQTPHIDHANYKGGVAVQWISPGKGNGLVAKRDFAPGDLLFVDKAFEAVYKSECTKSRGHDILHNECVARIIGRISKNKDLLKEIYGLFAGPGFERFKDTDTDDKSLAVDSGRVAAIVGLNALGGIDFTAKKYGPGPAKGDSPGAGFAFDGCGIWIQASYMNHSCIPNTVIFYVGDLMIVRAAKRIRKGEELTTSYTYIANEYGERQEALAKYGFKCECELCVCDLERIRNRPDLDGLRKTYLESFNSMCEQLSGPARDNSELLVKLTQDLEMLAEKFSSRLAYKNRCDPHLECLYAAVGCGYNMQQKWLEAAKFYELAYFAAVGKRIRSRDILSNAQARHIFVLCSFVARNYERGGEVGKLNEYFGKILEAARVCFGSVDPNLMKLLYDGIA